MSLCRCFSSLGCPELSLSEVLTLAERHGIAAVELRALAGTVELAEYFAREFGTPEGLAAKLRGSPVRIAAFNASLRLVGSTAAERDQLEAFAPWADVAGARWLRVFDGGHVGDIGNLAAAAETIRWWRSRRAARGWKADIMVETHDSLFTAGAITQFLAAVPDVAILWDAHHTWKKGGEDPLTTWRAICASVVHVHVKDSVSRPSARHPFTYVLPGDGEFPVGPLLGALHAGAFAGPVSLEWERMWHPYLPPLDEALRVAGERGWW